MAAQSWLQSTNDLPYKFQDEKGTLGMGFILDVFPYENGKIL